VGRDDVAEVLRRRLLDPETVQNKEAFRANVVAAVRALVRLDPEFAKTPAQRAEKEKQYLDAFPFDPALMDVFYSKWTSRLAAVSADPRRTAHLRRRPPSAGRPIRRRSTNAEDRLTPVVRNPVGSARLGDGVDAIRPGGFPQMGAP
jgi:hypothetical protein